jgi:hypothetical protein
VKFRESEGRAHQFIDSLFEKIRKFVNSGESAAGIVLP